MKNKKVKTLISILTSFIIITTAIFFLLSCSAGVDIGEVNKILSSFGIKWPAGFVSTCLSNEEFNVIITARDQNGNTFNWTGIVTIISTNANSTVSPSTIDVVNGSVQRNITFENGTLDIQETYIKLSYGEIVTLIDGAILVEGNQIPAPENVNASDGLYSDKITVQWDSVADAEEYGIYRADADGGPYVKKDKRFEQKYAYLSMGSGTELRASDRAKIDVMVEWDYQ